MSNIKFKFIKENDEIKINLSMIDKKIAKNILVNIQMDLN